MASNTSLEKKFFFSHHTADGNLDKDKINLFALKEEVNKRLIEINKDKIFESYSTQQNLLNQKLDQESAFQIPAFAKNSQYFNRRIYFSKTQKWVGHILEINGEVITAKLNDINNPTTYEIAEFDIDEIPLEDRGLISEGAGFYWSLGQANDNGQIEKKSLIRFQRTKPWEDSDINQIIDTADDLYTKLRNWE